MLLLSNVVDGCEADDGLLPITSRLGGISCTGQELESGRPTSMSAYSAFTVADLSVDVVPSMASEYDGMECDIALDKTGYRTSEV